MRNLPVLMTSALEAGAAKLCHVWLITRRDGVVLGFTDHDADLTFQGVLCIAATGLTKGAAQQTLGTEGSGAVSGILSDGRITPADIEVGLYDETAIREYVIDWTSPDQFVLMSSGTLGRIEARGGVGDGASFVAHVEGPAAKLNRVIGRRFTHLCDAGLGDTRCGLSAPSGVCDKRYRTCREVYANTHNFRGFPDLPGEDFLTLYPRAGDALDGASRRQGSGR
ncbi:DUF2163 domain-containing protein [Asticcacaulis endophyticus]|uniref:Bacteriophage phiJL001 Gp84 C-terminal domain-containing protein n=1 Tax=Asticcacaulis endophyticus TaxID=1395890 RepID=A0A918QH38_9CAUL|nr:DUF2163 domain-containing protein [Asticcacaulis endophyticus]GGZ45600.1 hypothetical protein GCM10011273_35400 [Asticcacaulis endophyticus]